MKYGYARSNSVHALEHASLILGNAGCEEIALVMASGLEFPDQLKSILEKLKEGDILAVPAMENLTRDLSIAAQVKQLLDSKGATLEIVQSNPVLPGREMV